MTPIESMGSTAAALPAATTLAVERTRLTYVRENQPAGAVSDRMIGPRGFALLMIGTGLTALALATIEHRRSLRALRLEYGHIVPRSLATLIASFIGLLGILGLLAVILHL